MTELEANAIAARHADVFHRPLLERFRAALIIAAIALYMIFAWWLFAVGQVISNGNWDIAGSYLADWVSYEVRPDIEYDGDALDISFPRFSPLGDNPKPDWVETEMATVKRRSDATSEVANAGNGETSDAGFLGSLDTKPAAKDDGGFLGAMPPSSAPAESSAPDNAPTAPVATREEAIVSADVSFGGGTHIHVQPGFVTVTHRGETLELEIIEREAVNARGALPEWASQRAPGSKVIVQFGFAGRAEIEDDEVKVRRRFLGWENFFFDTRSPYWGMPASEVLGTVFFGERIEEDRSNLSLALDNIVNNADWQHGDVWLKLLQTIVMAFAGTVFASLLAFPLAFAAARNIMPNRFINHLLKRSFDFLRSVDMLIWALFFTRAFGPGPLAGISAIFFTDTGTFGKLYSEALENIDDKQREGVRSVGASPSSVQRFGVVPQVLPVFLSQSLYFWESNTRSATIIGAVGAGGIGLKLWEAMRTNQDWENVAYMVILILMVVFIFDNISNALRQRLIGRQ
ncbi:phosphonate ABC transporter, permease protein PhnE [Nitratireductor kimnyeongensis]|uniref:Phosphonate ABC transporter, permease protein PhnE n=1 Tax=Nitratireductor kimnyeongensis TaxID=430679 RepID=A0ABW0T745_9HYPH|nr:phosphonate ABC transporter, permease protein PhnE [Nitratireductor kimnyeongensis]QZZ34286.1 phosphonate ABC transporter, permease protein PhnE [Nitratireductor kimnyeongensis]